MIRTYIFRGFYFYINQSPLIIIIVINSYWLLLTINNNNPTRLCFAAEYANGGLPRPTGLTKNFHPDFLPTQASSVDNPEYHLTGGEPCAPVTTTPVVVACNGGAAVISGVGTATVTGSSEPQTPGTASNGRSLEDESDHEYYNDFDRLQRELQPLRRNETTVWPLPPAPGIFL